MLNVDYTMRSFDAPHSSSFQSSLNSIDENKTIYEFNDFIFAKKHCADAFSNNYFNEKRQSEPAIRFSFYNKLFDIDGSRMQRLTSPPKDYRKYSLPLSMSSSLPECPISSLMSPTSSCKFAVDVPTWRSFNNAGREKLALNEAKFQVTINDEYGHEIHESSIEVVSPMDDENCLFYDECQIGFENNFIDEIERNENNRKVCKKCGHLILKV